MKLNGDAQDHASQSIARGIAMFFDNLETLQPRFDASYSGGDFVGIAIDTELRALCPGAALGRSGGSNSAVKDERLTERVRIAQELHDTLLQGFVAASMHLHVAVDRLSSECPEKQRFTDIAQMVDRVLDEGRCALQGLRPRSEPGASLGVALARVPSDLGFAPPSGFRVVVLGREKALRLGLLDEVYRIGREAIVNACRHSQAKEIEAEVEYRPTELRIAVRDNGRGMGPQELEGGRRGHWGLGGMRERADRIGARLRLWSRVALGTEVELCVPGWIAFEPPEGRSAV
jgi:signal transduction histidine kinase